MPEETQTTGGTDIAGVIAPPPLIALATVALGLFIDWLFPVPVLQVLLYWPTRVVIGGVFIAAGVALGLTGFRVFSRVGTNANPWLPAVHLATGGIYQWVRNPMYVGFALLVAGIGIALASTWTLVLIIPAALVMHYGVVRREERYLEAKFGDAYRRYKQSVPRYGWPT
jgi:protein-S-isoprenylcysteine O-methyltransferase Ste14